jgi:hypothetical protein
MQKNPHAVALGRKGGKKGGAARARKLTAAERSESARRAVLARWKREPPKDAFPPLPDSRSFFESPSLEELAARQGYQPSGDPGRLGGVFPDDFDVDAFVADIYRERRHRR